jgi:zinc/manganese transport system ATP-binding protein
MARARAEAWPIHLRDVTVRYARRIALDSVSGTFAPGSLTAVVGANGAGKSTLLGAIAGTVRLSGGSIDRPAHANAPLAWLPQRDTIDRGFPVTVTELIMLGGWRELGAFRAPTNAMCRRAEAAAETVGLSGSSRRRIDELSAGEFQRALFARLILRDAAIMLLDEPFAAVDAATTAALLRQIARWHDEGRTVIAVLHDLAMVRGHFPSTLVLDRRCLAWGPTGTALPAMAA